MTTSRCATVSQYGACACVDMDAARACKSLDTGDSSHHCPMSLSQAGKLARSIWAEACATDEKDAILGVQQARNAMTACTYLATISVALATAGAVGVDAQDSDRWQGERMSTQHSQLCTAIALDPATGCTHDAS